MHPAVHLGEKRGLISRKAAGNRAYKDHPQLRTLEGPCGGLLCHMAQQQQLTITGQG